MTPPPTGSRPDTDPAVPPEEKRTTFLQRGGAWVLVQFVLMTAVLVGAVVFRGTTHHPLAIAVGIAAIAVGGFFGIAGVQALGRNRTPFPEPREGSNLIQTGIYGIVRHPLYTSVLLISLGWTCAWESAWALLPAILQIPFFHRKAILEERRLIRQFPDYADYARRVPRFLPRFY